MDRDTWFNSIKWSEECLNCHTRHDGYCPRQSCAEYHYDEWGDIIPSWVYHMDGNNLEEYLSEKRQKRGER